MTHNQDICICSLGLEQMKVCPNKKEHICVCKSNNQCRQHKTFQLWSMWANEMQSTVRDEVFYFYWIPEEVLMDIISLYFGNKKIRERELKRMSLI